MLVLAGLVVRSRMAWSFWAAGARAAPVAASSARASPGRWLPGAGRGGSRGSLPAGASGLGQFGGGTSDVVFLISAGGAEVNGRRSPAQLSAARSFSALCQAELRGVSAGGAQGWWFGLEGLVDSVDARSGRGDRRVRPGVAGQVRRRAGQGDRRAWSVAGQRG